MAFSNILQKIFKSSGQGPEVNDGILSKDITIQSWYSTHDYLPGTLVKSNGGGASSKLYFAKQSTGPSESVGPQDPSLDTGNTYWSVVSVDDGNVVHKSGWEEFSQKTYSTTTSDPRTFRVKNTVADLANIPPSSDIPTTFAFIDKNGNWLGGIEHYLRTDGTYDAKLFCYKNTTSTEINYVYCGFDSSGNPISLTNSTSSTRTDGNEILTRDWIPKDTRIVHTTGAENISGIKTFENEIHVQRANPYVRLIETDVEKGVGVISGGTSYQGMYFADRNDNYLAAVIGNFYGNTKSFYLTFRVGNGASATDTSSNAIVGLEYGESGIKSFRPEPTNDVCLGSNGRRWKEIWCNQSSINTSSDERLKTEISVISDDVLDAWEGVNWIQFKYKDAISEKGSAARFHSGVIAQQVDKAFADKNLDVSKYGLFLHDTWEATEETRDKDGMILSYASPAGDEYGLRYTEALCMEAAYNRRRVSRVEERLLALEQELAELKKNS